MCWCDLHAMEPWGTGRWRHEPRGSSPNKVRYVAEHHCLPVLKRPHFLMSADQGCQCPVLFFHYHYFCGCWWALQLLAFLFWVAFISSLLQKIENVIPSVKNVGNWYRKKNAVWNLGSEHVTCNLSAAPSLEEPGTNQHCTLSGVPQQCQGSQRLPWVSIFW